MPQPPESESREASANPDRLRVAKAPLCVLVCGAAVDGAWIEHSDGDSGHEGESTYIFIEHPDCDPQFWMSVGPAPDAVVIRIDARDGVTDNARRSFYLAALTGIPQVVVGVAELDFIDGPEEAFRRIEGACRDYAAKVQLTEIHCIPVAALGAVDPASGKRMPWYRGPGLRGCLAGFVADVDRMRSAPFRFTVDGIHPKYRESRGYQGMIVGGSIKPGERVRVQPLGQESKIARIVSGDNELAFAMAGDEVTLFLEDSLDLSPGDLVSGIAAPAGVADQFETTIVWTGGEPMLPSRTYRLQIGARSVTATLATPKYKLGFEHLEHLAARRLEAGDIGVCNLSLDQVIAFDPHRENRRTGRFALFDRLSNERVGAGFIHFALRRADNIHWQALEVNQQARMALKGQRARCFWFTGLSASGKSTIANLLDKRLCAAGRHTYLLDGDNVRHGLNRDLGFTEADRVENIRRISEVARLMVDAGLIVLVSFISPFRAERRFARSLFRPGEFVEVYVDTPFEVCEQRDPKGLYKKARSGALKNFTGLDSPYESPENPEIRIDTTLRSAAEAAEQLAEQAMRE